LAIIAPPDCMYFSPWETAGNHTPPTQPISSHSGTTIVCRVMRVNASGNSNNLMPYEVRKVQDCSNLILVSIPKMFTRWMQIQKGSLVKVQFVSDDAGNRVVVSKIHVDGTDGSSPQNPS
jgi:hypothetical protein